MPLKLITAPEEEPLTLAEAKAHLRVVSTDDDALITSLIASARQAVEGYTQRSLMLQTWELALRAFPTACRADASLYLFAIQIPKGSLYSITSVKYVDESGVLQTMDEEDYQLDDHSEPPQLVPAYGTVWPATRAQPNAVLIRYVAGYPEAENVPEQIKSWMKLRIGTLYENREEVVNGVQSQELGGNFVDRMLDTYKIWGYSE
jgi:uncharacterized phiE125 gp8 family phage protein